MKIKGFKVGMKVRFKKDLTGIAVWGIDTKNIAKIKNKVVTISSVSSDTRVCLKEDKLRFSWNIEFFKPAIDDKMQKLKEKMLG